MSGFGREGSPFFWVREGELAAGAHVAFAAPDQATVEAFHAAALGAGGKDNVAPGERPHYHPRRTLVPDDKPPVNDYRYEPGPGC